MRKARNDTLNGRVRYRLLYSTPKLRHKNRDSQLLISGSVIMYWNHLKELYWTLITDINAFRSFMSRHSTIHILLIYVFCMLHWPSWVGSVIRWWCDGELTNRCPGQGHQSSIQRFEPYLEQTVKRLHESVAHASGPTRTFHHTLLDGRSMLASFSLTQFGT